MRTYTGKMWEWEILRKAVEYAFPLDDKRKRFIVRVNEVINFVRKKTNWNTFMPESKLAQHLCYWVGEKMCLTELECDNLEFFPSVGSVLDLMGVDCFFIYKGAVCSIDLKTHEDHSRVRADVVWCPWFDVQDVAEQIAKIIKSRIGRY